jgi:hypothetical protein
MTEQATTEMTDWLKTSQAIDHVIAGAGLMPAEAIAVS